MSVSLILIMRVINILFLKQETNMVEGISLMYMYTVFPDYALVCYLHMQMQTLCRAVAILISTSYSTRVKIYYRSLTQVFIASPFCDQVHERQVKRNHLSWICREPRWMSSAQSWIIVTLTIGCKKTTTWRQHSEPIEFEELSRQ